jgi:hypothetical protein
MFEMLEVRELFSVTLTDAGSTTTQPATEPEAVVVEKVVAGDLMMTKKLDKSSPRLAQ